MKLQRKTGRSRPLRVDLIRRGLFLYAVGLVVSLQLTAIIEAISSLPGSIPFKAFLVLGLFPGTVVLIGFKLFPATRSDASAWFWGGNALIMLTLWGGGYFVVGHMTGSGPFHTLFSFIDDWFSFRPGWVFVYITVYPLFVFPLLYLENKEELLIFDLSQILALGLSYSVFIAYPVIFHRPTAEVTDFGTWTISVVQGTDPAWNCFPSTHCTACTIAGLSVLKHNRWLAWWAATSTMVICLSTLYTKQHYAVDVFAGVLLGTGSFAGVRWAVRATVPGRKLASTIRRAD